MVMQANPYTGTDRPPTPEEQAALSRIAQMRAAGFSDQDIFQGGLGQTMNVGGGYGYLPYIADMAGIQSGYNLGRGNLALGAADLGYQMQQNPYNVVSSLQFQRDTGAPGLMTDPTLANVPQSPMSSYLGFIDGLLKDQPAGGAPTGDLGAVQRVRDEVGDTEAMKGFERLAALPPIGGTATTTTPTPTTAYDPLATQRAAATLVGSSNLPGASIGETQLQSGAVPGFSSFTDREAGNLSGDQFDSWMGLVGNTGRTSDPYRAYQNYQRLYGHRGTGGAGRTIR